MAKHNDKAFQDKIKMTFRNHLEKQFRSGLAQGMYAACKVVRDKASDETKSLEDRIEDILAFCDVTTGVNSSKEANAVKAVG